MNKIITESYVAPDAEIVEVCVELGFANSCEDPVEKEEAEW